MSIFLRSLFLFIIFGYFAIGLVFADETEDKSKALTEEIAKYESEISKLQSQSATLGNQIAQFDAQIKLATLKIEQTQEKVLLLGGRIDQLETSLGSLTRAFTTRVVRSYKMSRLHEPVLMVVTSPDLDTAFSSYKYMQKIQGADRDLLVRLEKAQSDYKIQKEDQETLEKELVKQKIALASQKTAKATLLSQTKNDEKKYQQLLASARSELESIQAIIAGKGTEELVGNVSSGQRIASTIQGASCNSGGTHTHFIVRGSGNITQNPFSYLKSVDSENCSGSSCGSGDGDSFSPSGSWDWPVSPKIKFTQGYGSTWAVRNSWVGRIYSFHNGIDINGTSLEVKSVANGKLYRGSYTGSGSCRLRYVRVDHDNSDLDTLYLHINY